MVTVQLPLYNEMYVVRRLIDAVGRLDYPRDRLEIQVLDDSTDETPPIAAARGRRASGRAASTSTTSAAPSAPASRPGRSRPGWRAPRGELIAVFDADFVPPPEFLKAAVPHFADPAVGMVQARWGHLNRGYSLLTRVQAHPARRPFRRRAHRPQPLRLLFQLQRHRRRLAAARRSTRPAAGSTTR